MELKCGINAPFLHHSSWNIWKRLIEKETRVILSDQALATNGNGKGLVMFLAICQGGISMHFYHQGQFRWLFHFHSGHSSCERTDTTV